MSNLQAQIQASEARRAARRAQAAAEEALEGQGSNPFITFTVYDLSMEKDPSKGFFANLFSGKERLQPTKEVFAVKRSDIAYLTGGVDSFGTEYTIVHLEDRCNIDVCEFYVLGNIEQVQRIINEAKVGE